MIQSFTPEQIAQMTQELTQLVPPAKPKTTQEVLQAIKPVLASMRDRGFTIEQITEALSLRGVTVKTYSIQRLLVNKRSSTKRAKKPATAAPETQISSVAASGAAPAQAAATAAAWAQQEHKENNFAAA